jgi:hypothetical protein
MNDKFSIVFQDGWVDAKANNNDSLHRPQIKMLDCTQYTYLIPEFIKVPSNIVIWHQKAKFGYFFTIDQFFTVFNILI